MEDMNGPEFLKILEAKRPDLINEIPIVFLTGMDKIPDSRTVGFIRKPFDIDEYLDSVHRFIAMGTGHLRNDH
jgi:FixJ family two-component response regulator